MPRVLLPFAGVLAAVAGGLYVVFLPLIGLAYILVMAGARVWQGTRRGASWLINAGEAPQRGTGGRGGR